MKLDEMLTEVSKLYRAPLDPGVMAMYEGALSPFSLDDIRAALNAHVASSRFMPQPSEIITLIHRANGPARNWGDAWNEIITQHGETEDPIGRRALGGLGGWSDGRGGGVGYVPFSQLATTRAQFRDIYESMNDSKQLVPPEDPELLPPSGAGNRARLAGLVKEALK